MRLFLRFPRWLKLIARRDVIGIAIGSRIYIETERFESEQSLERILRHELEHVRQMRRDGLARFVSRYVVDYVRGRARGWSHREAYRNIRYEVDARQSESSPYL